MNNQHGVNTEYSVRMQENAGKMRTRITPNTDTYAVQQQQSPGGVIYQSIIKDFTKFTG